MDLNKLTLEEAKALQKKLLDSGVKVWPAPHDYDYKLQYEPDIRMFRSEWHDDLKIDNRIKGYTAYYIHDYYPKKRDYKVDYNIEKVRSLVNDFKNGRNSEQIASLIIDAINTKKLLLSNTCLVIIPAHEPFETELRFKTFCSIVSQNLNILNGFGAITADPFPAGKGKSGGNKIEHFHFDSKYYGGKRVLVFDDVHTSGTTFRQVIAKLYETGAKYITGIFLAQSY